MTRDLDMSDVYADALNDPTLDRPCEEGSNCSDPRCPLIHESEHQSRIREAFSEIGSYEAYLAAEKLLGLLADLVDSDHLDEALEEALR